MFKTVEVTYSVKQEDVKSSKKRENSNRRSYSGDKMTDTTRISLEIKKSKSVISKRSGRNDPTLKSKSIEDPLGHKNWQIPSSHIDRDFLLMEFDHKVSSRRKNNYDNENDDFQSKALPDSPRSPSFKNRKNMKSSKSVLGRERKCNNTAGAVLQIDSKNNNNNISSKEWISS